MAAKHKVRVASNWVAGKKVASREEQLQQHENNFILLYRPLTHFGLSVSSLGMLDAEAEALGWTAWFTVRMLRLLDAAGNHLYKLGRTRRGRVGQRLLSYIGSKNRRT